ncbi:MAG: NAD(P)-binding protein, partial [Burkholderiaceae bacterium]
MQSVALVGRSARPSVAIVGAGWAGLSAAVRFAEAGIACTVFEASKTLGGRARRVQWQTADGREIALDNGQHILIGAYRHTLALLAKLGINLDDAFERTPLQIVATSGFELRASRHRAPWHLVIGILRARKLDFDERWAMATFMLLAKRMAWTLESHCTVNAMLDAWEQPASLTRKLWEPLCIAALNTTSDIASAQVFLNVMRDSLGADARDSDLL